MCLGLTSLLQSGPQSLQTGGPLPTPAQLRRLTAAARCGRGYWGQQGVLLLLPEGSWCLALMGAVRVALGMLGTQCAACLLVVTDLLPLPMAKEQGWGRGCSWARKGAAEKGHRHGGLQQ